MGQHCQQKTTSTVDGETSSAEGNIVGRRQSSAENNVVNKRQRRRQIGKCCLQKATSLAEGNVVGRQKLRHGFFFIVPRCLFINIHYIQAFAIIWHLLLALVPCLLAVVPPKIYKSQGQLPCPQVCQIRGLY